MAVGNKFTGANLSITIGGTAMNCPQSFRVIPTSKFVEYECPGAAATLRVFTSRSWDASAVDFTDNDDFAKTNAWNAAPGTAQAVIIYPDGITSGQTKITFSAYVDAGIEGSMGSIGSNPINFTVNGDVTLAASSGS